MPFKRCFGIGQVAFPFGWPHRGEKVSAAPKRTLRLERAQGIYEAIENHLIGGRAMKDQKFKASNGVSVLCFRKK